ncbi:cation diffusion facilitator family transporter [Endothiovibrio diazotrophicus]
MAHHHQHDHGHSPESEFSPEDQRYLAARRVTIVGALINLVLSAVKVALGILGNSQALVADGVHSLSDLATDVLVLIASKHGSKEADEEHPYGHGRIETLATVILGVILIAVGLGILWDAVLRLFDTDLQLHPGWLAMAGAAASIFAKEGLYHYTMVVARRLRSNLLKANAWHHRSDAVSSVVVVVGIAGSMAGLGYLDAIAAAIVALMVTKIGFDLGWTAIHELIDTALEREKVVEIERTILAVPGVEELHLLRTRRMGADALVDVHIILTDPRISVSEGHQISETVRATLIRKIDEVSDVTVHIDPEDDEAGSSCQHLPLRDSLLKRLGEPWRALCEEHRVEAVRLHYLFGRIEPELLIPMGEGVDPARAEEIAAAFNALAVTVKELGPVVVRFH